MATACSVRQIFEKVIFKDFTHLGLDPVTTASGRARAHHPRVDILTSRHVPFLIFAHNLVRCVTNVVTKNQNPRSGSFWEITIFPSCLLNKVILLRFRTEGHQFFYLAETSLIFIKFSGGVVGTSGKLDVQWLCVFLHVPSNNATFHSNFGCCSRVFKILFYGFCVILQSKLSSRVI